jgi:pimeloyl-ACP methyl ester carboxylesterase
MQHLVLLHGAIGNSTQLKELQENLSHSFDVHLYDFPGHGGTDMPEQFSIPLFAESLLAFLNENSITQVDIFGYSMGGFVAMYLAKHHPERVNKITTLATKFEWNESVALKEIKMLQPEIIEQKIPAFAEALRQRHHPVNWRSILNATAEMLLQMGKDTPLNLYNYSSISQQCLLLLGDKDKMVSMQETEAVANALPNAKMMLLPDTPHPIEHVNTTTLAELLSVFFKN